ncbi:MAG: L-threonylcarbamoyladenylate synthase [Candidatus Omnitrophota bacterium]
MISTKIIKVSPERPEQSRLKEAADALKDGRLVIIPTETVYGIAADMSNNKALGRLYKIKKRPENKPFSLHVDKKERIEEFASAIPASAYRLIDKFWPGPLTLILKSKNSGGASGIGTIGLRMPDNKVALEIIAQAGVPIICPSANISGKPAPVNFSEAIKDLNGLVELAIDAGSARLGIESSIVDLTVLPPEVLREGAVKKEDILAILRKKNILFVCTGNSCRSVMAEAVLKKILKEKNRDDVEVVSAGIMMMGGTGATESTREILRKRGMDVSGHISQRITPDMVKKADMILVMEQLQEKRILEMFPEVKFKLFLLKEFAKISDNSLEIDDPIGKPVEFYEKTFEVIKESVERISSII